MSLLENQRDPSPFLEGEKDFASARRHNYKRKLPPLKEVLKSGCKKCSSSDLHLMIYICLGSW